MEETFARILLRIYDRKLMSGEITFSQSGIKKDDFTRLCIDPGYVPSVESIETICSKMNLSEEERSRLLGFAREQEE